MKITSINPANESVAGSYEQMSDSEAAQILEDCNRTWLEWKQTDFAHRSALMKKAANILRERKKRYARIMTDEMGKTLASAEAEVEKCAWVCDYYAENAQSFLSSEIVKTDASESFVCYRPIGIVLAVMPWNFPFWQVFRFAAPALMAGNAGVLKHASNVFGSALAIEEVFRDAGFPGQLFRSLLIGSAQVDKIIENEHVKAVTLTGSTPAGRAVAGKAGEMLKKTVLELGGSDAYVVLEDADLDSASTTCVNSRLINAGQSCIAAKRFIVVEKVHDEFVESFVSKMGAKRMGDPTDPSTDLGPQARMDLRDELHSQVEDSIRQGAKCLLGGKIPEGKGAFYPPTVLSEVQPGMPAYDEELFGPVASIIRARDEKDAVRIANDSPFGLGSAVFTSDPARGRRIAELELEAGSAFVNEFVKSDPRLPFGGIKTSGYGRELSAFGIREFVNIKTVYIK
ncbi:MAG: NAD-dependent succinate-semialdehyde dehydrogenase [Arenicellales bacterium]